jgi:hypothetical protein
MQLSEFLTVHPPDTDLRVVAWESDGAAHVRCVLRTSPWWMEPARRPDEDGTLTIDCREVLQAGLHVGQRQAEVEDLEVLLDAPRLWAYGEHASIYGNAPLPDPDRFFARFADLVEHGLRMGVGTSTYLGTDAEEWRRRVTGAAPYLLLTAPVQVVEACRPYLDEQPAEYSVIRSARRPSAAALQLVVVGESWIICREATVAAESVPVGV